MVRPDICGPARLLDHTVPPSRLRYRPPFSVPTRTSLESAGATSIALMGLPSKWGETACHAVPSLLERHNRDDPAKTLFASLGSSVMKHIQTPSASAAGAGGETSLGVCEPRKR